MSTTIGRSMVPASFITAVVVPRNLTVAVRFISERQACIVGHIYKGGPRLHNVPSLSAQGLSCVLEYVSLYFWPASRGSGACLYQCRQAHWKIHDDDYVRHCLKASNRLRNYCNGSTPWTGRKSCSPSPWPYINNRDLEFFPHIWVQLTI